MTVAKDDGGTVPRSSSAARDAGGSEPAGDAT